MHAANIVSALSKTQSAQVTAIEALPKDQQAAAARDLLAKTFNLSAAHTIRSIFNLNDRLDGEATAERDAHLESAFSEAMGARNYQRLLEEKWLRLQGESHLKLSNKESVAREVAAATEFLSELDGETAAELATPRPSTEP